VFDERVPLAMPVLRRVPLDTVGTNQNIRFGCTQS